MRVVPSGDAAVAIVPESTRSDRLGRVRAIAAAIQAAAIPGVVDIVAAAERVAVGYDPLTVADLAEFEEAVATAAATAADDGGTQEATHELPVIYDGPDLDELCAAHGLERDAVIRLHAESDYLVEAVGFLPGFGYLAGLPEILATPRRATPRPVVPAGSVGIGGSQTGVYPFSSPGGWHLIGRSAARLFDVDREQPSLLAVGDRVRFKAVSANECAAHAATAADQATRGEPSLPTAIAEVITILAPGLFTTIQDLGRPGYRGSGVPLSGAADRVSLAVANAIVGNVPGAAAIECTLLGPTVRFEQGATVALAGADFPGLPSGQAIQVAAGTEIMLGHVTAGCRGYLAVAGGIAVPSVLGSRSTFVPAALGGFAGRPLRAGDRLRVGERIDEPLNRGPLPPGLDSVRRPRVVRVVPGEHAEWFAEAAWGQTFRASSRSNRMGARLEGDPLATAHGGGAEGGAGSLRSIPVFPGTVQVPPDGCPIILLADAQTIGGYPVFGHVIAADLPIVAQLRPGGDICWEPVSLAEAHAALREQEAAIAAFCGAE
jgi:KipI family sensor histidine kinase inhibitor